MRQISIILNNDLYRRVRETLRRRGVRFNDRRSASGLRNNKNVRERSLYFSSAANETFDRFDDVCISRDPDNLKIGKRKIESGEAIAGKVECRKPLF